MLIYKTLCTFLTLAICIASSKILEVQTTREIDPQKTGIFLFYSSLCSVTQRATESFDQTYKRYYQDNSKIAFYKVDMSVAKIPEKDFNIKAYPVIILSIPEAPHIKYDLGLNPQDLAYFIEKNMNRELPSLKNAEKLDSSFDFDYLSFIGNPAKFPNTYSLMKNLCFTTELVPCLQVAKFDDGTKAKLIDALRNQGALRVYIHKLLEKNKNKKKETFITFDNEMFQQVDEFKRNITLSEARDISFEELEIGEMNQILSNSSVFNEILLNIESWNDAHKDDKSYSLEDTSLDYNQEAIILYRNIQLNKAIFLYITESSEKNIEVFEKTLSGFLEEYASPLIYPKFTHRLRKHMTEKELIGVALFAKKKFYSNNENIQFFVKEATDLKNKVLYDSDFMYGQKAFNASIFFILDPEEDSMNKQLAKFIGVADDKLPEIYAFRFKKETAAVEKLRFEHSRYTPGRLLELIQSLFYNTAVKLDWRLGYGRRDQQNSDVLLLNGGSYTVVLNNFKGKNKALIIEYTTEYCRECSRLNAIINKMSKITTQVNDYKISYARIDIFENDFLHLPKQEVPFLRVYKFEKGNREYLDIYEMTEEGILKKLKSFLPLIDRDL